MKQPYPTHSIYTTVVRAALIAACAAGYALSGSAVAATDSEIQAQYQNDVARCNAGQTNQDKATCLQEAGAAREEARRHRLTNGNTSFKENQLDRCKEVPADQQADCIKLMTNPNATVAGSVESGGVLREETFTVPATPSTQGPTNVEGVIGTTNPNSQPSTPVPGTGMTQ